MIEQYLTSLNMMLDNPSSSGMLAFWHDFIPMVGVVVVLLVLLLKRFGTKGPVISSILHLYLVLFILQIWAVFEPSLQTIITRVVILIICILTIIFACRMKKIQRLIKAKLTKERRINEHLRNRLRDGI